MRGKQKPAANSMHKSTQTITSTQTEKSGKDRRCETKAQTDTKGSVIAKDNLKPTVRSDRAGFIDIYIITTPATKEKIKRRIFIDNSVLDSLLQQLLLMLL